MDSDTGGGKSKIDFSDIMSILGEGEQGQQKKPEKEKEAPAKKAEAPPVAPKDDAFVQKLLADIEQKNAEILKLNSENMSLKYSLSEKDMEVGRLRSQADSIAGQVEGLKSTIVSLNQQNEDLNRYINDARARLGEMDADRVKLTARMISKESEQAPPEEEDVASIFKRIALKAREPEPPADAPVEATEKPQQRKKLSTAKLYDL